MTRNIFAQSVKLRKNPFQSKGLEELDGHHTAVHALYHEASRSISTFTGRDAGAL